MGWIRTVLGEILGLFVDDWQFAAVTAAWLLVAWLVPPRLGVQPGWAGPILFAGLAAIVLESAVRRAGR